MHDTHAFEAAQSALEKFDATLVSGREFIHIKTWTKYRVLGTSLREHDLVPVVTYMDPNTRRRWTRPCEEFCDLNRYTPVYI
jgi:hypothetical protein